MISRIDHVALTFRDLEAAVDFYDRLFGVATIARHVVDGRLLVQQVLIGTAMISMHQHGNGITPVAGRPTPGSGDICLQWDAPVEAALALLAEHRLEPVAGPAPRTYSDGRPATSVYLRDIDGNLIELMAAPEEGNNVT
jgi:catechol 2,3-dioxygenase-like lactoylglutathione lyase family enzyme